MSVVGAGIASGLPHPLLVPEQNPGWMSIRRAYEEARGVVEDSGADVLVVYSTMWPSIIGHQVQADPAPQWVHVDELFHELGSIPYRFRVDAELAEGWVAAGRRRGLQARTVSYRGFPIDTGSVVACKLLNPDNRIPVVISSSNVYADRAETLVHAKALGDALSAQGKKAFAVCVMSLSNRLFTEWIDPADDRIHSPKDDEWNRKLLEFLGDGRLEDAAQLSREIHRQIRVRKLVNFKPLWWLSGAAGQHNRFDGRVHGYAPVYGTGAAVVTLIPAAAGVGDKEFDEEDVEVFRGDRSVLGAVVGGVGEAAVTPTGGSEAAALASTERRAADAATRAAAAAQSTVNTAAAPKPVGAYPHARREGDLLFLSGVGPRQPGTDAIPGGPIRDAGGAPLDYDAAAQTRAVIKNVKVILEAAGSSLDRVIDVTSFLVDMDRDFADYNTVYAEYFTDIQATRTTLAIRALPTPIAVEMKIIARAGEAS